MYERLRRMEMPYLFWDIPPTTEPLMTLRFRSLMPTLLENC